MTDYMEIRHFSDRVVFKDEFGDTVSFQVDEGVDGDLDNAFYMTAHNGDTNEAIDFLFTHAQFSALIKFVAGHVIPDESLDEVSDEYEVSTNEDVIEHVDEGISKFSELLDRIEAQMLSIEHKLNEERREGRS